MKVDIIVPSPGESITQVQIASWLVSNGQYVDKNAEIAEIESDKATLAISASESGIITILRKEGETVEVGQIIGSIEVSAGMPQQTEAIVEKPAAATPVTEQPAKKVHISPLARNIIIEKHLDTAEITKKIGTDRISKKNVLDFLLAGERTEAPAKSADKPGVIRTPMSPLRQKLAERLVSVRLNTAMLTTFNEVNMKEILQIRSKYKDTYKQKFGYSLGLISFFARASAMAMKDFPVINAMIEGTDILQHEFVDINIAVSSPKGLITPIIRNVQEMKVPQIEQIIKEIGMKAAKNRISMEDLALGTFTITNGGVFGSMMSTPLINPPQAAILGMHKISERPMVVNSAVEILPMMFIALSYDHRLIDGRESVGFVVKLKEILENPISMGLTSHTEFEEFLN